MNSCIDQIDWNELEDAYGKATEVPALLKRAADAKGSALEGVLGDLASRVLHQGTIYSSSPHAAQAMLDMLKNGSAREKDWIYGFLAEFADSARLAIRTGHAIPCHAGGEPEHGRAIQEVLVSGREIFLASLQHRDASMRGYSADLLLPGTSADTEVAPRVVAQYEKETDAQIRKQMFKALMRVSPPVEDWQGLIERALQKETDPESRLALRSAQIGSVKEFAGGHPAIEDLVKSFVEASGPRYFCDSHGQGFLDALQSVGEEKKRAALMLAFDRTENGDLLLWLMQHMLRDVFVDRREGWGPTATSRLNEDGSMPTQPPIGRMALSMLGTLLMMKLAPWYFRRRIKRAMNETPKGIRKVEYWGLRGDAPVVPETLTDDQREVLRAAAAKQELWQMRTNLWQLFGLPDSAEGLRALVGNH